MATLARDLVAVGACRGKHLLLGPFAGRGGELARKAAGQFDVAGSGYEIALVLAADELETLAQVGLHETRQDGPPILVAFTGADDDLAEAELKVFHAPATDLEWAQAELYGRRATNRGA